MSGHHAASSPPWGKVIFTLLATYAIAWLSPIGHGDAIDRYGKQLFNRVLTARSYGHWGEGARAATQVVLLSDRDLQQLRWVWPATYGDHAGILSELRAMGPSALMIDIAFVDARPDPTLPELVDALTAYARDRIPVFLATVPQVGRDPGIRPELANWPEAPAPRPQLVSVPPLVGANGYPLFDADGRTSAALAVYRAICDAREPRHICAPPRAEFSPPARDRAPHDVPVLELFWGARPDPQSFLDMCRDARPPTAARVLARVGLEWFTRGVLERCPFTPTLSVSRVLLDERDAIHGRIKGRAVFYGAALVGSADLVDSPVHGRIPGVYAHAMALDNLMTFGADYKRESAQVVIAPGLLSAGLAALALAALLNVKNPRMRRGLSASDYTVVCLAGLAVAGALAVRVAGAETSRGFWHFEVTTETVQLAAVIPTVQGFLLWFLLRAEQRAVRRRLAHGRPRRWELVGIRVVGILGYLGAALIAILMFAGLVEFAWLDLMPGHWTASIVELAIGRSVVELEELGVEIVNSIRHG